MNVKNTNHPIILVEDNPADVDLTLRAFKKQNLTNPIIVARDGEEAINLVKNWEEQSPIPIVILLDLKMPKFHGLEVLKEIKSDPVFQTVPVVILTSSEENSDLEKAYKLGASSYIVKPVGFDKFINVAGQIELYWTVLNKPFIPSS